MTRRTPISHDNILNNIAFRNDTGLSEAEFTMFNAPQLHAMRLVAASESYSGQRQNHTTSSSWINHRRARLMLSP